jgi:diguanylate cyclase (GGDEF)-like protein
MGFRGIPLDRGKGIDKGQRNISLSFGVAIFPDHGQSVDGLLRSADEALYQAKMEGKDRVVVAESGLSAKRDLTTLPV